MKKFRKIMAVLVAAIMIVAMTVPAWAAGLTLTYDNNGGTGAPEAVESDTTISIDSGSSMAHGAVGGVPVKFIGWTETDYDDILTADAAKPATVYPKDVSSVVLSENKTIYALWGYDYNNNSTADAFETGDLIDVKFHGRDGSGIPVDFKTRLDNGAATIHIPDVKPTKSGCTFVGWTDDSAKYTADVLATESVASTDIIDKDSNQTITQTTNYYAIWAVDANGNDNPDYSDQLRTITYHNTKTVDLHKVYRDIEGLTNPATKTVSTERDGNWYQLEDPVDKYGYVYDEVKDETVYVGFIGWKTSEDKKLYPAGDTTFGTLVTEVKIDGDNLNYYPVWGIASAENQDADIVENAKNNNSDTVSIAFKPTSSGTAGMEEHVAYKVFDVTKSDSSWKQTDSNIGNTTTTGFAYSISRVLPDGTSNPWFSVFWSNDAQTAETAPYVTLTATTDPDVFNVAWVGNTEATTLQTFANYLLTNKPTNAKGSTFKTGELIYTKPGYYLITSTLGTKLVLATSSLTVTEKNDYITDSKVALTKSVTVGKNAVYFIKVYIPATAKVGEKITVHDVLDSNLEFDSTSVKVSNPQSADPTSAVTGEGDALALAQATTYNTNLTFDNAVETNGSTYKLIKSPSDGDTFEIEITIDDSIISRYLVFKYEAQLLSSAIADRNYPNSEFSTYSKYKTKKNTINIKTYDFDFNKVDFTTQTDHLSGAVFELRKSKDDPATAIDFVRTNYFTDGTYKTTSNNHFATSYDGALTNAKVADKNDIDDSKTTKKIVTAGSKLNVSGLGAGVYYLVETVAPQGYMLPEVAIKIVVADDGTFTVESTAATPEIYTISNATAPEFTITNITSTVLPSTGGMGTTVLYIVGGMLVILAGAYLFFSRKRTA